MLFDFIDTTSATAWRVRCTHATPGGARGSLETKEQPRRSVRTRSSRPIASRREVVDQRPTPPRRSSRGGAHLRRVVHRLFAAECGHGVSPLTRPRARCTLGLAEGVGFEPAERSLNAQRFSRPTGVLPLTCLLATVWTGQGTARAPAAGPARRTRRPRHPQLEKNARKNTRCGGYGSELRFLGPRDGP